MSNYKSLKTIYHQSTGNSEQVVQAELDARLSSAATLTYPYHVGADSLFVVVHLELQTLMERVWRNELRIQRLWGNLPPAARNHYLMSLLIEEIQSTNEIENVHSTRQEVTEALQAAAQTHSSRPGMSGKRFLEMARTYHLLFTDQHGNSETPPYTVEELRKLYDELLGGEISAENQLDGRLFRTGSVAIWDGSHHPVHQGIAGEDDIIARLKTMLDISSPEHSHGLVHAIIAHFMLEHIHPFYDGNGRFGRFLLALHLRTLLSVPTALSLTAEVMRQKRSYYKAFIDLENPMFRAEASFFVASMLSMLVDAQGRLEESLQEHLTKLDSLRRRVATLRSEKNQALTDRQLDILFLLGQIHLFGPRSGANLEEVAVFIDRSKGTVRPDFTELTEVGYVTTLSKKPLVFALTDLGQKLLELDA